MVKLTDHLGDFSNRYLTVVEAAKQLKLSRGTVRQYCHAYHNRAQGRGVTEFPNLKIGRYYFIPTIVVEEYKSLRRPPGRPKIDEAIEPVSLPAKSRVKAAKKAASNGSRKK